MKTIKQIENIKVENGQTLRDIGVYPPIYHAYQEQKETGNNHLDFTTLIWEADLDQFVNDLKRYDVDYITLSGRSTNTIDVLAGLKERGCELIGVTKVMRTYDNQLSNALKIKVA